MHIDFFTNRTLAYRTELHFWQTELFFGVQVSHGSVRYAESSVREKDDARTVQFL
jgi:hypothetical protein